MVMMNIVVVLRKSNADDNNSQIASGSAYLFLVPCKQICMYVHWLSERKHALAQDANTDVCFLCVLGGCVLCLWLPRGVFQNEIFICLLKKDDVWYLSWVTLLILFWSAPSFHSSTLYHWTCFHFGPRSSPDSFNNTFPMAVLLCAWLLCWN